MKLSLLSLGLLVLSPLTAAWSKEDREIFRIRDEIAAHEVVDTAATFYDVLGIANSASLDDINKAYRKLTRSLHPDKVTSMLRVELAKKAKEEGGKKEGKPPSQKEIKAAVKEASERQARLSLIANILRGPSRDRYDHFLSNGFPLWKGTDYLYDRYRPGFGTVITGLFLVVGGGVHYFILYMNWKRHTEFVERYIKFARDVAWGDSLNIPGVEEEPAAAPVTQEEEGGPAQAMNRRQRRMQEKEQKKEEGSGRVKTLKSKKSKSTAASRDTSTGRPGAPAPTGARKRVVADNGKVLVVDAQGDVYLEERDEEGNVNEFLLDPAEIPQPTFKDTAVIQVPVWMFNSTIGRFLPSHGTVEAPADATEDDDSDRPQMTPTTDSEDFEMVEKSTDSLVKAKSSATHSSGKANKKKGKKK